MQTIFNEFTRFISGLSTGTATVPTNFSAKILFISKVLLLIYIIRLGFSLVNTILYKFELIGTTRGAGELSSWLNESSLPTFVLQVVILAPLFEEVAFRGILQPNHKLVAIAIGMLTYLVLCVGSQTSFYVPSKQTLWILSVSLFMFFTSLYMLQAKSMQLWATNPISQQTKIYLIWLSACGFALWHYNNFNFETARVQTIIFTLLPLLIAGLIFSWISIRYGLLWSIGMHIINNLIPVLFTLRKAGYFQ